MNVLATTGSAAFVSIISLCAPTGQTGKVMGAISVIGAIGAAVAGLVYGWIFARTSGQEPLAVYVISAGLNGIAFGVAMAVWCAQPKRRGYAG